jgi:hypothetical protein
VSSEIVTWLGGGLAVVLLYIVISNTLWLLVGSRIIQCLPGVNIQGFRGTLKIAAMLILSFVGVIYWSIKFSFASILRQKPKPLLSEEIAKAIKGGARILTNWKSY